MRNHLYAVLLFNILLLLATTSTSVSSNMTDNPSACSQPQTPGLCRGKLLRYAYNSLTGNCISFYYSGCASTANNFLTFEECRRECMKKLRY